jgi:hypothetical protein
MPSFCPAIARFVGRCQAQSALAILAMLPRTPSAHRRYKGGVRGFQGGVGGKGQRLIPSPYVN